MVEDTQVAEWAEMVLPEPTELVLEIAFLAFERGEVVELDLGLVSDAQKLKTADHSGTVESLVGVGKRAGMTNPDECEETLRTAEHAAEPIERVVRVTPLEGPEQPRVERVVAARSVTLVIPGRSCA